MPDLRQEELARPGRCWSILDLRQQDAVRCGLSGRACAGRGHGQRRGGGRRHRWSQCHRCRRGRPGVCNPVGNKTHLQQGGDDHCQRQDSDSHIVAQPQWDRSSQVSLLGSVIPRGYRNQGKLSNHSSSVSRSRTRYVSSRSRTARLPRTAIRHGAPRNSGATNTTLSATTSAARPATTAV